MGLNTATLSLNLDLWKNGFYKDIKNVMDMGSQDVYIGFEALKAIMELYNVPNFNPQEFEGLKQYPAKISTQKIYNLLGIETYTCLDLGSEHNALRVDLNQPLENKDLYNKYDLVTDLGNNEHPFNVAEAYRTMHRLCRPGGFLMIDQAVFNGNGYYNFDIPFFEGMAAVNGYEIIYGGYNVRVDLSHLGAGWESYTVNLPLFQQLIKSFDWSKLSYLGITYIFRKKLDKDFVFPYQGYCHTAKFQEAFLSTKLITDTLPLRGYVPIHLSDFTFVDIKREILKRIKNRFKWLRG